ncbi:MULTISPECIES: hypothetical protein [Streptomyces]|uniref:Secreted protein n=1 Tax=Streptomyces thermoviolaceus subsp. thermoviolaceus TaxID=66860 RepID=A0ABX0YS12_STRTL|nr:MULTISPECIES: hypothetical protein [Streptomyces]MCM3262641.1 hypothetical protein [Streptomyces thermoviolaceus]NJP13939.1 hypothetical protein [Streptomyces thermoviolaceus subsp. thermoviolaceus]RSS06637.1 hypothetical protein EF917_08070 [Streptomyces sp. WAC00469]WTD50299.1 hypothetical protein OG899_23950 [Streptomyces thermoviolaceus]
MKKRSMLALASLATGFVVAAVSPSHAEDREALVDLTVKDAVGTVDHVIGDELTAQDDGQAQGR